MNETINAYLNVVKSYCNVIAAHEIAISFREDKSKTYLNEVKLEYENYKTKYMGEDVKHLDRHKIAAILVICGIKQGIIESKIKEDSIGSGNIDISVQKILLLSAFDYLTEMVNNQIEGLKKIEFSLPVPFSCSTNFIDVLSRTLYYAQKDDKLNEMELAEKFFLLEYISILQEFPNDSEKYFEILRKKTMQKTE